MPIIRKRLSPSDVYPEDIRYDPDTDTVQRKINGDWVDAPESDPRAQTTYPPRITANPPCDAAQSVIDALQGQIDQILEAIDNASTAFTIAGIILSLFSFGVFAIFITIALFIADQMIAAGSVALEAALTPSVYHQAMCILSCQFNASGRLKEGGLAAAVAEINSEIGGLAALVLTSMLNLAGEGGVNNLASIGTSEGDCDDCDCDCGVIIINGTVGGWTKFSAGSDLSLFDWSPAVLAFNIEDPPGRYIAAGYSVTSPDQVLSILHEYDEPCLVNGISIGVDGRSSASRIIFYKKVSGVWSIVLNSVAGTTSGITTTVTIGEEVEAVQIEFFTQFYAVINSVLID